MNREIIDFIKVLGIATIFMLLFSFIFGVLNNMILNPFRPIQKSIGKLKYKNKLYIIFISIVIFTSSVIKSCLDLSDLNFALLFGFLYALNEFLFSRRCQVNENVWSTNSKMNATASNSCKKEINSCKNELPIILLNIDLIIKLSSITGV